MLTKQTIPSQRRLASTAYVTATMTDYALHAASDAECIVAVAATFTSFPLSLSASAEMPAVVSAGVTNYGTNAAVAHAGIVGRRGTMELAEGIFDHNLTGNVSPSSGGGSGAGLSGVDLEFDQVDPDNPVLKLRQDSSLVASAPLPKATSAQAGIIESSKFDEIGTGGGAGDIDGGTF